MRSHDKLTNEQKQNPTPPPIDNAVLRSIVDWIWEDVANGVDDDKPAMSADEYKVRADKMKEYKKLAHAHILLLSHYAASDNPRLHKKAHYHLNEIQLLKKKVEFSYGLLSFFKKPTPPFNYYLAAIVGDASFWRGVDELIQSYLDEDSMINPKNNPTPTEAH